MKVKRRIKLLNQPNKIVHNFRRHRCRVGPPIWDPEAVANYPILTLATRGASTHLKSHSNVLRPVHKIQGLSSTLWARNADLKFKFVLEKKRLPRGDTRSCRGSRIFHRPFRKEKKTFELENDERKRKHKF